MTQFCTPEINVMQNEISDVHHRNGTIRMRDGRMVFHARLSVYFCEIYQELRRRLIGTWWISFVFLSAIYHLFRRLHHPLSAARTNQLSQ